MILVWGLSGGVLVHPTKGYETGILASGDGEYLTWTQTFLFLFHDQGLSVFNYFNILKSKIWSRIH